MKQPEAAGPAHPAHRVERPNRDALVKRLRRIGGQVEGLARMVGEDRYCVDILTQVAATRAALDALALELLHDHTHGCVQEAIRSGDGERALDELMSVIKRFTR